jgi:ATP-dependent Clp protease ATP-binding subunit ClpC
MALGANFINAEHILVALIGEPTGPAAKALQSLGMQHDSLQAEARKLAKSVAKSSARMELKHVIDSAINEADALLHSAVRGEHLLLGLLHLHGSVAVQTLNNLGASSDDVRAAVLRLIRYSG